MPFTRLGPEIPDVGPKPPYEPAYLGDGAYVAFDGYQFEVYASNGVHKSNQVFLEIGAIRLLNEYAAKVRGTEND